jgi:hypothetical protein
VRFARGTGLALGLVLSACALSHEVPRDVGDLDARGGARVLTPCPGIGEAGTGRDCGWQIGGSFACRPGSTIRVGCAEGCGLGSCSGDTMLRVCDTAPCSASFALAFDDDSGCGGLCSFIDGMRCPDSGEVFVLTAPFSDGAPYRCVPVVR